MTDKEKAYGYLGLIVGLALLGLNPDPHSGSTFGWVLYGAMMTGLVIALSRTVARMPDYSDRSFTRNSRSHHEVK